MQIVCFIYLATDLRSIYFKSVTIVSSFTRLGTYANVYQGFFEIARIRKWLCDFSCAFAAAYKTGHK